MRIRCIGAGLFLPEFVGQSEKSRITMAFNDLQSQRRRAGYAGHQGIIKRELVGYQQMQLAIDLLLHILQFFQLWPFAQAIGLTEGNHVKKHITAWCRDALLQYAK